MAEWKSRQLFGDGNGDRIRNTLARLLPDWQVFVRHADGRPNQFTIRRKHQIALLASAALVAVWAGIATTALVAQPDRLAARERELNEMIAAARATETRLASTEKLVGDIAHEVEQVHNTLVAFTETSDSLSKDPPGARLARGGATPRMLAEPAAAEGEDALSAGGADAMRAQMRRLEESLDRLKLSYTRAAQQTAEAAANRISHTERQIARLGLNTERLIPDARPAAPAAQPQSGQGGPFIPAQPSAGEELAMDALVQRVQQWNGVKAAMQRLPLAIPIRGDMQINSGFGTRADPLNHRSAIHEGLDFGAPIGTPIYATGEGVVTLASPWDRYGNTVEVDHGNGIVTRYAHMSRIKVKKGQRVTRSTVVGLVGNTGRSTGAHLHYEIRVSDVPKDPIKFISVGRDVRKNR